MPFVDNLGLSALLLKYTIHFSIYFMFKKQATRELVRLREMTWGYGNLRTITEAYARVLEVTGAYVEVTSRLREVT